MTTTQAKRVSYLLAQIEKLSICKNVASCDKKLFCAERYGEAFLTELPFREATRKSILQDISNEIILCKQELRALGVRDD